MAVNDKARNDTNAQTQSQIANQSFDQDFQTSVTEPLGFDGKDLQRMRADAVAIKMTVVGPVTYLAYAAPGTLQSDPFWQCRKIDESSGFVMSFADGDASFNNVATDLTALAYL